MGCILPTSVFAQTEEISSFSDLKNNATTTFGYVHVTLQEGTRVLAAKGTDGGAYEDYLYLWDGTTGACITGNSVNGNFFTNGVPTKGQTISGDFTCYYNSYSYNLSMYSYYEDCAANVTFGDAGDVTPTTVTLAQLAEKVEDNTYAATYVKVHGTITSPTDGTYAITDGTNTYNIIGTLTNSDVSYMASYVGKEGDLVGIVKHITYPDYSFSIQPIETDCFTEGTGEEPADDPNKLDTYAKWKSITTQGETHAYIPANSRVVFAKGAGSWDDCLYIWDGHDGGKIAGFSASKLFKGTVPEKGQLVTGDFTANYFINENYFYYDTTYYAYCQSDLTFGEVGPVTPLSLTLADIASAEAKTYDWAYAQVDGIFVYDGDNNSFIADGELQFTVNPTYIGGTLDALKGLNGHNVALKGIVERNSWNNTYSILPVDADCMTDKGEAPAEEVVYDAETDNDVQATAIADLTIKNLNFKAGKYYGMVLPIGVDTTTLKTVFGDDVKVYISPSYFPGDNGDTIKFNLMGTWSPSVYQGNPVLIRPSKNVKDAKFGKVRIPNTELWQQTVWKGDYSRPQERQITYQGTFKPVSTDTIPHGFALDEDGHIVKGGLAKAFSIYFTDDADSIPVTIFAESDSIVTEPVDDDLLDTYAEWKAIDANGMEHLYIPENSRVLFASSDTWKQCMFIWDGKEGFKFRGTDVPELFNGTQPKKGQSISGDVNVMFFSNTYDGYYYKTAYPECSANLTYGDSAEVTPIEVSLQQLADSTNTKAYYWAYAKVKGVLDYQDPYSIYLTQDTISYKLDLTYCKGDGLAKFKNHNVELTCIAMHNFYDWNYALVLLDTLDCTDLGAAAAVEVVYDADAENDVKQTTLANVIVNNLAIKADTYKFITLPFNLEADQIKDLFGSDVKVYQVAVSSCTPEKDTLKFTAVSDEYLSMYYGTPYLIKTSKDVPAIAVEGVKIESGETYPNCFWPEDWYADLYKENIMINGTYSPVSTDTIADTYGLGESGKLEKGMLVKGFSAYITDPATNSEYPLIMADGEIIDPVEDGIRTLATDSMKADGKVYNVNGQLMLNTNNLPAGVYIRNGKKFIVK